MTEFFVAASVIIVCVVLIICLTHKNSYRSGFIQGKRFILTVLRHVSPDAADKFQKDTIKQYNYDIFTELEGRDRR